jgi:hypothetical protein
MLVIYMNRSPLTEYRMKDIGVVLRIYEWVLLYAAVLYEWGEIEGCVRRQPNDRAQYNIK